MPVDTVTPMCGIVGYVGHKQAQDVVLEGLRRLEYRGYDSAGIALVAGGVIASDKRAGKLANLEKAIADHPLPAATTGIGHTRWATHGAPNDVNAHPHTGGARRVALVHNGIIENFAELRAELEPAGHVLLSETDTEVAAQLLELEVLSGARPDRRDAALVAPARGRVHARRGRRPRPEPGGRRAPQLAAGRRDRRGRELPRLRRRRVHRAHPRGDGARPGPGRDDHPDRRRGRRASTARPPRAGATTSTGTCRPPRRTATTGSCARRSTSSRAPWPTRCWAAVRRKGTCTSTRCGSPTRSCATSTRSSSSRAARRSTPAWSRSTRSSTGPGSPVEVELASEFRYRDPILDYSTLVVAISQSGETADTLQAIRHARTQRSKVLAICNTNGSTIPRESDAVIYTHAGPEIGVASTKGFLTQLVACYLLALYLAQVKGTRYGDEIDQVMQQLEAMPDHIAAGARRRRGDLRDGRATTSTPGRCCSSAGTPATRSRSRVRSSSRSWPTSTPRASPPASSSTARSR